MCQGLVIRTVSHFSTEAPGQNLTISQCSNDRENGIEIFSEMKYFKISIAHATFLRGQLKDALQQNQRVNH